MPWARTAAPSEWVPSAVTEITYAMVLRFNVLGGYSAVEYNDDATDAIF